MSEFLEFVRGLGRRDTPPTSAELRQALAEAEAAGAALQTRCAELATQRADVLLTADDKSLDRIERDLQLAQRDLDRAEVAAAALRERILEAEASERQAELDAAYDAAMAAQKRGGVALAKYEPLARKVAALLVEVDECEAVVAQHRTMLEAANDPRRKDLTGVDRSLRPCPEGCPYQPTIVQLVELPGMERGVLLWPPTTASDRLAASAPSIHTRAREIGSTYVEPALRLKTIDPLTARFPGPAYLRSR